MDMKPQMTVHYAVERPRGDRRCTSQGSGAVPVLYRGHIEPRAAQLHLSHGIVFFGRSPGPPPGSFQDAASAARMRDASSRDAFPPAAGRPPSGRQGARGARPSRAPMPRFADRRRCCPSPRLCQWCAAPERHRRPIAAPPCASSRRCMTAPAHGSLDGVIAAPCGSSELWC